jgi:hypothetical protein
VLCLGVVAAICGPEVFGQGAASPRGGPGRFFRGLIARPEPEPVFLDAPTPPPVEQLPELERRAAGTSGSGRAGIAAAAQPSSADRGRPAASSTAASTVATLRAPTWDEAGRFAQALVKSVSTVAIDAANPHYQPKPKPPPMAAPTAGVPVPSRNGSPTPPLVAARLQPSGPPAPRTQRFERLRGRIAQTLAVYQRRPLNTAQHTPWEVMHGFIAFGVPTQVRVGGPAGDLVNAIGWSNMGGRCRGQAMLTVADDHITALKGIGVQGHAAQYLAILAQCRVAANSPIVLGPREFTVADLVEEEKLACREKSELTFALIALAHYLPTDTTWTSRDGIEWSLAKLMEEEIVQTIRGAACGGTHRLFGLSYGCQRRKRATGSLDGVYLRADKYVRDYQHFALTKLQNKDGSFSTEWFKYSADRRDDIDRKIQTTGHILEWLVASIDQERLYDPRIVAATEFLADALAREPSRAWKIGPLGHALHALNIYQERAWGIVLPGGVAAYHGPMKASERTVVADLAEPQADPSARR